MKPLIWLFLIVPLLAWSDATMLAKQHHDDIELEDYFVSEKLDGIRARWTGERLLTRNDNPIYAPDWFTEHFPDVVMDGELWSGRGEFQFVSQTVRDTQPDHEDWKRIQFMVFDLPQHTGSFAARVSAMRQLMTVTRLPQLQMIEQLRGSTHENLMRQLADIEAKNGEGLMLHHTDNHYHDGRSDGLLKLKSYEDAEATVVGYTDGKGKFDGLVGALIVETESGIRFRIGSGLSLNERKNPPEIGSRVTYKFYGHTKAGKPRFASYLRERLAD